MNDVFIEFMVKKQKTPQTTLLKFAIVLGEFVLCAAALVLSPMLGAFSILAPLLVVGGLYGAYYLVTSFNVEYEYSVTNGELDVDQIVAQRKRKRLVTINCRNMDEFGRYRAQEHLSKNYQTKIIACDNPQNDGLWYCVGNVKDKGKTLVVFNANEKMLDAFKTFLPRPLMHKAFIQKG